ncbi:vacuolar protein sorting-associated family 26 protein [Stieleria varia]|uniref:Arrestin-like N-terminal domain-containing protein n=1 Tax=Stieleria varia TaxID=2528005 RepID=A0A5C6A404_9BACT|nr:sporulation protein [Stieleria varia]TWT94634.1 hypothetical protein Pla52n_54550 [Stieleria varia]
MAKCDLSITLDEPSGVYPGGGKITGTVKVHADADVKCKGLDVQSVWKTHGRGNVASGTVETVTLFTGQWTAGQSEEYRFELPIAEWPPSYHGNYLNIDHYIEARAKIPWAFDPKASVEFLMQPTCGPEIADAQASVSAKMGMIGWIFTSMIVFMVFGAILAGCAGFFVAGAQNPFIFFIVGGIVTFIGGFIAMKYYLPKFLLGEVHCELKSIRVSPGEQVNGELKLQPRKNVPINGVTMKFVGKEVCISGSGSNRTTHSNTFYETETVLEPAGVLKPGVAKHFPLSVPLPGDVPYSIDLNDNDIKWSVEVRVDIPRWPDWSKSFDITVVPSGKQAVATTPTRTETTVSPPADDESGLTFAETASHIWSSKDDKEQVEMLVDAVNGLNFDIEAFVERRLLYSGEDDPHVYKDGYAVWARYTDPPLPMVLYVPHDLADEFEQAGRDVWSGRGTVVGWDSRHRRLQVKLLSSTSAFPG